jgi:hypothetical protein
MEWLTAVFDWFSSPGQSNAAQWGVSALALVVAFLALLKGIATDRRLKQESRRAKLRGFIERQERFCYLVVANDGAAIARNVSATINGEPLSEFLSKRSREADVIGPGNRVRHLMSMTVDNPLPKRAILRLEWSDNFKEVGHTETSLTL